MSYYYRDKKRPESKSNWLDKAIAFVAPGLAERRMSSRFRLDAMEKWAGASKSKSSLRTWVPGLGDADADSLEELPELRMRSRDLARNVPIATGAIKTKVTNVIGSGLRLQANLDRNILNLSDDEAEKLETDIENEFRLWCESVNCDTARQQNFYGLQRLAFRGMLESGDIFALLPLKKRTGIPYSLTVQMIEADRVETPPKERYNPKIRGGIEKSHDGEPINYYIATRHPGDKGKRTKTKWTKYLAFGPRTGKPNVLHFFIKDRAGQSRGIPDLAPVIETLKLMGDYTESEAMAALVASFFTVFIESPTGETLAPMQPVNDTGGKVTDKDYKMGPGAVLGLAPGQKVNIAKSDRPNTAFDAFIHSLCRQISVAIELPYEVLMKHFTASYSASRAALVEAWKYFSANRILMSEMFCQPIYEAWLYEAVALGRVNAPGFFGDPLIRRAYCGATWIGPGRGQIDEKKEIEAAKLRIDEGLSTRSKEAAKIDGGDFLQMHNQRVKEERLRKDADLISEKQQSIVEEPHEKEPEPDPDKPEDQ